MTLPTPPPNANELFVPGRVCLFGEHSDWAGQLPSTLGNGQCLVYNTDVGIHAWAWKLEEPNASGIGQLTIIENVPSSPEESTTLKRFSTQMDPKTLRERAADPNEYFAYMCGTAAVMLERYASQIDSSAGLTIFNDATTVPMRKGFSSSAAICVLVAQAFQKVFQLKGDADAEITSSDLMDAACHGEWATSSLCGRMDQCVALGPQAVASMTFSSPTSVCSTGMSHHSIRVKPDASFYFVVADLCSQKDTKQILSDLQSGFESEGKGCKPHRHSGSRFAVDQKIVDEWPLAAQTLLKTVESHNPSNELRVFLSSENKTVVSAAERALEEGDGPMLGALMTLAQYRFNACAVPNSKELIAPKLHDILRNVLKPSETPLVWGGKGVGSQGDGSIQFICRSRADQQILEGQLNREGLHAFAFTVSR